MVKIWKNEGKSDKIIAVVDNMLYKCTPKEEDADEFVRILKRKDIPEKNVFGIQTIVKNQQTILKLLKK